MKQGMVFKSISGQAAWYCAWLSILAALPGAVYFGGFWQIRHINRMLLGAMPLYFSLITQNALGLSAVCLGLFALWRCRDTNAIWAIILSLAAWLLCRMGLWIYY